MKKNESGQALILVLLSLSVVLTLILYIISRSITDIAVSGQQADSVRAFSAAEAGIEKTLVTGSGSGGIIVPIGNAQYISSIANATSGLSEFAYPSPLLNGDSATFWLAAHDANGNLTTTGNFSTLKVCWGNWDAPLYAANTPAVEVTVYYEAPVGNGNVLSNLPSIRISRTALDQNPGRALSTNFSPIYAGPPCILPNENVTYKFQKIILNLPTTGLILARVKVFYNDTPQNVGIVVIGGLPSQGQNISSIGVAGGSNRKITVFSGWREFPFASDALFSPSSITHQ